LRMLVVAHIAAGFAAIAASITAASSKALHLPHRVHRIAGRTFSLAMLGTVVTAVPMALLGGNLLLLLVAILSGYLAFAGWREAVRSGTAAAWPDRAAAVLMMLAGMAMIALGTLAVTRGNAGGIVLLAFGAIGFSLAWTDLRRIGRPCDRPTRIANHLIRMMGATIAVITAFLVVNVRFDPGWVVWLAPTVVLTPLIIVWSRRARQGRLG
ncbi:MAG: hypothetical protein RJA05_1508, partial [Planctomycetota bacterium]